MCPTAISMNAYVLRIHILPYVVELCSESVLTRHPDTGLARMSLRGLRVLEFSLRWRKTSILLAKVSAMSRPQRIKNVSVESP